MAKTAEKVSRKDTGNEDLVSPALVPLAVGLEQHWKTIVTVTGLALVVLAGVAIALQLKNHNSEEAAQSFGDVLVDVDKPVVSGADLAPDEKGTAGVKAAAKPVVAAGGEDFSTEAEKQGAIAKRAQETFEKYGAQPAGHMALLTLADAKYKLGNYQEAVDTYGKFLAADAAGDELRAYGQMGLAYALLGLNKKDDALAAAKSLADHPPNGFGRDLGLLTEGKIAEDIAQVDLAKQAYRLLRSEAPETAAGREATERLTFLGEPPTPNAVQ